MVGIKPETLNKKQAILIAARIVEQSSFNEHIDELKSLTATLGWDIKQSFLQELQKVNARTFFGTGKIDAIKQNIEQQSIEQVFIGNDISPSQARNLEKNFKLPTLDRSGIVLEIFRRHASTYQAKTQVELALLKYQLPRLTGLWSHLDRERGGSNVSKGMGERQINIDRTLIRERIAALNNRLKEIAKQRDTQAKKRKAFLKVCLAGYTNAGKTLIMNRLTNSNFKSADNLFTSLDSTTRLLSTKIKPNILLSDTVGFIRNLPEHLLNSFQTTLSSILEAGLILHVVDASNKNWLDRFNASEKIINKLTQGEIPIITLFSKTDLLNKLELKYLQIAHPDAIFVSKYDDNSLQILKSKIEQYFLDEFAHVVLSAPRYLKSVLSFIWNSSIVKEVKYLDQGFTAEIFINPVELEKLKKLSSEAKIKRLAN